MLIGDSTLSHIDLSRFHPDTGYTTCTNAEDFYHLAEEIPSNDHTQIIFISVGINNIKTGATVDTTDMITRGLTQLKNKFTKSKLCFSAMVARPSFLNIKNMMQTNKIIKEFCNENLMNFISHDKLLRSPNEFHDDLHPKNGSGIMLYAIDLKRELPFDNSRSRSPSRSVSPYDNRPSRGQGTSQGRGRSRGRGRYPPNWYS